VALAKTQYARSGDVDIAYQVIGDGAQRDLVAGSGLAFEDRGEHELKGVPDIWALYAAEQA
jgi:hypothetical protein